MKCFNRAVKAMSCFMFLSAGFAQANPGIDQDVLAAVQSLYGISEQAAIERLAAEALAAEQDFTVRHSPISSYAGSWFDPASQTLHVAISDPADRIWVKRAGAQAVLVPYSLAELRDVENWAVIVLKSNPALRDGLVGSFVDVEANQAVVTVESAYLASAQAALGDQEGARVEVGKPLEFSADIRAADGFRNVAFGNSPCSIGASIERGYLTAGHCGQQNHDVETPSGASLGTFAKSTLPFSGNEHDSAWVDTVSGWTPTPKVNGYGDGIFKFTAKWSGILEAPVNSTVCRYGQTSGGPDCGTVDAKNVDLPQGFFTLEDVTRVTGMCTDDGDSGGPHITPANQMQGTNIGGSQGNTCPTPTQYVYFQPVIDTLTEFTQDLKMLTTHGAVKPTINGFNCPSFNEIGSYLCGIDSYNSQGITDIQWSSNTGHSSTTRLLHGTCSQGQTVSVTLDVTNPYGTRTINDSFTCT